MAGLHTSGTVARAATQLAAIRRLSGASRSRARFVARTCVFPSASDAIQSPAGFAAKSVLLLSTPQHLPRVIEAAIALHQAQVQVVVAGVDRVVPNGASSGVSELWLDEKVQVQRAVASASEAPQPPRESDGINPVGAKVNWKNIQGSVKLHLGRHSIGLALAITLFATRTPTTLFYFDSHGAHMGQTLSELEVQVPQLQPAIQEPVFADRWTPLTQGHVLEVTKCTGNLVKSINKQPASSFLENNKQLMELASKSTRVYVKLFSGGEMRKYEVIAGGGGWGVKADLLALSPEAKVRVGDRVEFYMITPEDRYSENVGMAQVSRQFLFESPPESTSYASQNSAPQTVENLFGGGSESGLTVNGVSHSSPGESVSFRF